MSAFRLRLAIELVVTAGALAWVAASVDVRAVADVLSQLSLPALFGGLALTSFNLGLAAFRWRMLLNAYGARSLPPATALFATYLVGHFYNTFVPGAVGGDIVRGLFTGRAFDEAGRTRGLVVVAIDRAIGLGGLLALVSLVTLLSPLPSGGPSPAVAMAGLAAAFGTVLAITVGRHGVRWTRGALRERLAALPDLRRPGSLAAAIPLGIVTHTIVALTGHVLLADFSPQVTVSSSFVLVPLALAATYVPITVAGGGVREGAFVALAPLCAVPVEAALATSLSFLGFQLVTALPGGMIALARRRGEKNAPERR